MTLYTWRALSRGWNEPNWRIAKFWAPLFALVIGVIFLIAWLAAPLPRWLTFVVGIPLAVAALQGGAWLAGATREPNVIDLIDMPPGSRAHAEWLTLVIDAIIAGPEPAQGPPARQRPCLRCKTYRRWPRDRRHYGCHRAAVVEYRWMDDDPRNRD